MADRLLMAFGWSIILMAAFLLGWTIFKTTAAAQEPPTITLENAHGRNPLVVGQCLDAAGALETLIQVEAGNTQNLGIASCRPLARTQWLPDWPDFVQKFQPQAVIGCIIDKDGDLFAAVRVANPPPPFSAPFTLMFFLNPYLCEGKWLETGGAEGEDASDPHRGVPMVGTVNNPLGQAI